MQNVRFFLFHIRFNKVVGIRIFEIRKEILNSLLNFMTHFSPKNITRFLINKKFISIEKVM